MENIFENSDFVYMLNQAAGDRQILAQQLNISPHQLSYVTHSGEGEGLLFYGNVILPFVDHYMQLLNTPSVHRITQKANSKNVIYVAPPTVRKIHNILRSAFHQAVKRELMEKNPAMYATVPKSEAKKREIWDAPTLFHALEVCEDERLKLAINLAFACSLRIANCLA